jgi:histone acetyltransferase (RNA polymerase elongator complex component)
MKHVNIPIFIPHLGCPNKCVFCNQRSISGVSEFDFYSISSLIETALDTIPNDYEVEIAFFGGSFTGIDRSLMIDLLKIAHSYVTSGRVSQIRCSTRPDYIDEDILNILKSYGVKVIELGLQSTSDKVLEATKRGHSHIDEVNACRLIVQHGFRLIGQMMIGLPGSTLEDEIKTAEFIINSGASGARIYPTVVFRDTELCQLAMDGIYEPLELDDAVYRSAEVLKLFIASSVEVIRIGLCSSENLCSSDTYYAGPNHSAIGELVENRIYYDVIKEKIRDVRYEPDDVLKIYVARGCLSKAIGQKKKNKFLLAKVLETSNIVFLESDNLKKYEALVVVERKR